MEIIYHHRTKDEDILLIQRNNEAYEVQYTVYKPFSAKRCQVDSLEDGLKQCERLKSTHYTREPHE